jgi:Na+/melibiose symporter-like transporter
LLLQSTGYDAKLPAQPENVVKAMHYCYVFVPIVFWSASIILAFFYRLDRKRMGEIRQVLDERRAGGIAAHEQAGGCDAGPGIAG